LSEPLTSPEPEAAAAPPSVEEPSVGSHNPILDLGENKFDGEVQASVEGEPAQEPGAPDPGVQSEELQSLKARLEEAEKRQRDTEAWGQQAHRENLEAKGILSQLEEQRQREAQAANYLQSLEPPSIEDPDELLADPKRLMEYLQKRDEYVKAYTFGAIAPEVEKFRSASTQLDSMVNFVAETALEKAEREVQELGGDDFAEYRDEIRNKFTSLGAQGMNLMTQPGQIRNAYLILRAQSGKPMFAAAKSDVPPSLPPRTQQGPQSKQKRLAAAKAGYGPLWNQVLGNLGISEVVLKDADLELLEEGLK
jgi:hypothetical protein